MKNPGILVFKGIDGQPNGNKIIQTKDLSLCELGELLKKAAGVPEDKIGKYGIHIKIFPDIKISEN